LARVDWSAYECGCEESAEHLRDDLTSLINASIPSDVVGIRLSDHVEANSTAFPSALPAIRVILLALQEDLAEFARNHFLVILWQILAADTFSGPDDALEERCVAAVRRGVEVLFAQFAVADVETLVDILDLLDEDQERVAAYRGQFAKRSRTA
jgi:hypothetical protein